MSDDGSLKLPAFAQYGHTVRLPRPLVQPIAADDVANAVVDVAVAASLDGIVEIRPKSSSRPIVWSSTGRGVVRPSRH